MVYRPDNREAGAQASPHLLGPLCPDGSGNRSKVLQTALTCCAVVDSCDGSVACLQSAELRGIHDIESLAPFAQSRSSGMVLTVLLEHLATPFVLISIPDSP